MHKSRILRVVLLATLVIGSFFSMPIIPSKATILTQAWTPTSLVDAPEPRRAHVSVWTGEEMIVWGGELGSGGCSVNTGSLYDPTTDSWRPMSNVNAPAPRRVATAIWSGTEMIVWGGENCNSGPTYNDGGRYNPVTDSWSPISTVNAPDPRYTHTAVWTGDKMIVWGGDLVSPGVVSVNTGGIYDPATDSWTSMSTVNAPSPRSHPLSVWTGDKFIVWGGSDSCCGAGSDIPSGGIYDPSTDTWSSIAAGDPNAGFKFHTIGWTGTEMIVWSGHQVGDAFVNTGQRYNPDSNTWTPMSTVNAPSPRGYTTAIMAGNYFFVWGGYDGSIPFLGDGALYDPVSDSWTTITDVNEPSNRDANTLVYAGNNSVILWGGFNFDGSSHFLNTGSVFEFTEETPPPVGPQVSDFVVLGSEGVWLKQGSVVNSGDVASNAVSSGPHLNSDVETSIGINVSIVDPESAVFGDSVKLHSGAEVNDIYFNDISGSGSILGDQVTPLSFPVVASFPSVPTFSSGTTDVNIPVSASQTLNPGSYRNLVVNHDAILTFSGGIYEFNSWDVREDAKLYFSAATEIRIVDRLSTNARVVVGPAVGSGIDASDIKFFVNGINGSSGNIGATPKAAQFGMDNVVEANVYAPNGTLFIREGSEAIGSFLGRWVVIGENSNVSLVSGF